MKQARELERFQQETQLVSSVDTIGSNILAQNIFIETNDEQSKLSFLETCTELIQNSIAENATDNLLFMEFITSDAGHRIMEQTQLKVRVSDGALFIGNNKDLAENMFGFLEQQLNTSIMIIDVPLIYNGDLVGFGMYLETLGSTTDDKLDLGTNNHIKYLIARYNSLHNLIGVAPLLVRHTTMVNDLVNLEQIMDSNSLESVASLMSAYSSDSGNKIAVITYPSMDKITTGYGSITMEFQGEILAPVLTSGSEIMVRTLFSDLASTLSSEYVELKELLDDTTSTGDLSRLRDHNPSEISDWIVSDWFEYGKVPLSSQFITLPTAEQSLIAPSALRILLTSDVINREEMKNTLNMQGVFAFCKSVYTYLYQAARITLGNFETAEVYLQAAVNEWHNNITYGSLIDQSKVSVQAATVLVEFIKTILHPTYTVPPMITTVNQSNEQIAIAEIDSRVLENNIGNVKIEDEDDLAIAKMERNEQLLKENRIALQSIQEAVVEEQTQRIAQNKQLELMKNHYSGDLEQSYENCLRNV